MIMKVKLIVDISFNLVQLSLTADTCEEVVSHAPVDMFL